MNLKKYRFGVYRNGKMLFQIGTSIKCNDYFAEFIVKLLDNVSYTLDDGDYFASEFNGMLLENGHTLNF